MKALQWMFLVPYACPLATRYGCAAMVLAARPPFTSVDAMEAVLADAANQVAACISGQGGGGTHGGGSMRRKLQAWGTEALKEDPNTNVDVIKDLCSRAAARAASNTPVQVDLNALATGAAIATGLAQATLTAVVSLPAGPLGVVLGVVENEAVSFAFNELFYHQNMEDCSRDYTAEGCRELARAGQPQLSLWAQSPDCATCTADLQDMCQKVVTSFNEQFSEVASYANYFGSLTHSVGAFGKAVIKGVETSVMGPAAKKLLGAYKDMFTNLYGSFKAGTWEHPVEPRSQKEIRDALQAEALADQRRKEFGLQPGMGISSAIGGWVGGRYR
jgi:hypothetical protein